MNNQKQCEKCEKEVKYGYDTPYGYFCIDCWDIEKHKKLSLIKTKKKE